MLASVFLPSSHPITIFFFFFFNDTAPTEFYPLPLHDALPIPVRPRGPPPRPRHGPAARRAARARQHRGPGEPLGPRLSPGPSRRVAGRGAARAAELAGLPPGPADLIV